MSNLACLISSYLLSSIWEVAAIGGAGWLVSRLLQRLGPGAQHVVWVATLALAVAAPMFAVCLSLLNSGAVDDHHILVSIVSQASRPDGTNNIFLPASLIQVLSFLYVGALFYFTARLAWLVLRTIAIVRQAEPLLLGRDSDSLWSKSKRAFSVKDARILVSSQISGPVTIGLTRPVLLLPEGFTRVCTSHDFLAAIGHECAHIQRRDFQKNLIYEVASLFIAFHPIVWMLKSQIAQTREMICDAMAIEKVIGKRQYAQSLLRLVTMIPFNARVTASSAIGIFDSDILEKRIMMMTTEKPRMSSTLRYSLIIPGALLLCSVAGEIGATARLVEAKNASSKNGTHVARSCSYYDAQNREYPGTCGTKKGDKKTYYCFRGVPGFGRFRMADRRAASGHRRHPLSRLREVDHIDGASGDEVMSDAFAEHSLYTAERGVIGAGFNVRDHHFSRVQRPSYPLGA